MSGLDGKTILVTGASKGIGAAIAAALGRDGAHVIAHYGTDQAGAQKAPISANARKAWCRSLVERMCPGVSRLPVRLSTRAVTERIFDEDGPCTRPARSLLTTAGPYSEGNRP